MSRPVKTLDDPVVEEVRAIRADLWRKAGKTVGGLIALLDVERQQQRRGRPRRTKRKNR